MILDDIIAKKRETLEGLKEELSIEKLKVRIEKSPYQHVSFKEALQNKEKPINIIAEIKKASPSKGLICKDFDYQNIAKSYVEGGASAISVLTEEHFFLGRTRYLEDIKKEVPIPVLCKDFIIDPIQIYEAKAIGADAILLIVAALTKEELKEFKDLATDLELDALVEVHDEEELQTAIEIGAEIIGVNNRNLKTFEVNLANSERLSALIPKGTVFVAESGVHTEEDVRRLKAVNANALLIGESVVKDSDPKKKLQELIYA